MFQIKFHDLFKTKTHWDWSHILVLLVFVFIGFAAVLRLLWTYNGNGYQVRAEATLPYASEQVWRWATTNDLRPLWQVGLYDIARMVGESDEVDSTRRVFMIAEGVRWMGVESTEEVAPQTYLKVLQVAVRGNQYYEISIEEIAKCRTEIRLRELGILHDFWPRFFLFWTKSKHRDRLEKSLVEMKKWMVKRGETC